MNPSYGSSGDTVGGGDAISSRADTRYDINFTRGSNPVTIQTLVIVGGVVVAIGLVALVWVMGRLAKK